MSKASSPPALSILMPVRNEEKHLPAALASLSAQTFQDWELVAVDDGSTDRTSAILSRAAAADPRIRVLATGGQGLVPALNLGLAACSSDLVARMDGDDVAHPGRLQAQINYLSGHPDVGLVATSFQHFPLRHVGIGMRAYQAWQNSLLSHDSILADIFVESPFVHPSVVFRKNEVQQVGGYREMGWAEDYDLWLRLAAAGTRFARLPETLFFWRERPERTTRTNPAYAAHAMRLCKLHHLLQGFLKGERRVILAGAGLEGRAWYRILREAGIEVEAWVDVDPKKVGRQLHGAPVLATGDLRRNGTKLLMTVGARGARAVVRETTRQAGFVEGRDAVCVA